MTELLKCPFCGGEAEFEYQNDIRGSKTAVFCPKCGAKSKYVYESVHYCAVDQAAENWNRRIKDE